MADAALARREARRKKILENSHNRLQRISGKASDDNFTEAPVRPPSPIYQDVVLSEPSTSKTTIHNGILRPPLISPENLSSEETVNHDEIINDLASLLPQSFSNTNTNTEISKKTLFESLVSYKYDIVLLSMLIQFLYSLSIFAVEGTYFFLPLFIYIGTKLYWKPKQTSNSSLASVLMLLKGVSAPHIQNLLNTVEVISSIGLDVSIFVFTTICVQTVYIFINNFIT